VSRPDSRSAFKPPTAGVILTPLEDSRMTGSQTVEPETQETVKKIVTKLGPKNSPNLPPLSPGMSSHMKVKDVKEPETPSVNEPWSPLLDDSEK
jgi:hypothetical protein